MITRKLFGAFCISIVAYIALAISCSVRAADSVVPSRLRVIALGINQAPPTLPGLATPNVARVGTLVVTGNTGPATTDGASLVFQSGAVYLDSYAASAFSTLNLRGNPVNINGSSVPKFSFGIILMSGTTPTKYGSGQSNNFASVSKNAAGSYNIPFTTAYAPGYATVCTASVGNTSGANANIATAFGNNNSLTIETFNGATRTDPATNTWISWQCVGY